MNINLEFVAADNPTAQFEAAIQQAANILDAAFTDNITINLTIGYGEVDGQTLTNGSAAAGPDLTGGAQLESYSTVRADLIAGASHGDSTFSSLPIGSSINGQSQVMVFTTQQKLFGQLSATGTEIDGGAGFAKDISSSSLVGVALHELTHALSRTPDNQFGEGSVPDIFDFFNFTSQGNRLFTDTIPAPPGYFSLNGGTTKWADYGTQSDPSDTLNSYAFDGDGSSPLTPEDAFNQFYDSNTLQYLTPFDLEQMDALGFHLKQDAPASDPYDFNGDNSGDILLQGPGGQIEYANMANGTFQGIVSVTNSPGWNVVGEGKISGGVDSDIVIQNSSTGLIQYCFLSNGGFLSTFVTVGNPTGFVVVGVGDIADNHYTDIVIQNPVTDEVGYANMNNGVFNNWFSVADPVGWKAVGVADINDDGYADILIQNKTTDEVGYANMSNGALHGFVSLGEPQGYNVVGAGDINRLGDADVVIQNRANGSIAYANMMNGVVSGWVSVGDPVGWSVIAVEDILDNGYDDIVIQNNSTGQIDYADMTGGSFQGWVGITTVPGFVGKTGPGSGAAATAVSELPTSDADTPSSFQTNDPAAFAVQDAAASNGGTLGGAMQEPGTQFGSTVSGITMQDPGPQNGAVSSTFGPMTANSGLLSAVSMLDPGTPSAGAVPGSGPNDQNSASWLTEGALPGGTSSSNSVQNTANAANPIVAPDDLTHSLKFGT
jgi:hypothetical protein